MLNHWKLEIISTWNEQLPNMRPRPNLKWSGMLARSLGQHAMVGKAQQREWREVGRRTGLPTPDRWPRPNLASLDLSYKAKGWFSLAFPKCQLSLWHGPDTCSIHVLPMPCQQTINVFNFVGQTTCLNYSTLPLLRTAAINSMQANERDYGQ